MKHIVLPDGTQRRLVFYLAMEEYLAKQTDKDTCFFIWQVPPTVIFGRNQVMEAEVNLPYCKEHNIAVFRRKSGGGCVYADRGNLMLSCITPGENAAFLFDRYLRHLALLLLKIGVEAEVSGRNDILIDGRKVSGNAFYQLPGKSIIHGTLLFDTDFTRLQKAITPSATKLESKGISSARQRVTNLAEHTDMDVEAFKSYLIEQFCDCHETLTPEAVLRIEEIERTYLTDNFLYGHNPKYRVQKGGKTANAGEVLTDIELKGGAIRRICLSGDFFALGDAEALLNRLLCGLPLQRDQVTHALAGTDLRTYILNLPTEEWINLIFDQP